MLYPTRRGPPAPLLFLIAACAISCAATEPTPTRSGPPPVTANVDNRGVAVHGYDVVAYFDAATPAVPVKGRAQFAAAYAEGTYLFSSSANLTRFQHSPETYLPQYGGHCAYGMSLGTVDDIDPLAFTVLEGKLYLTLNQSVQQLWAADAARYVKKADGVWFRLSKPR